MCFESQKKAINRTAVIESETEHDYCAEIKTHCKSFDKSLKNYKIITYVIHTKSSTILLLCNKYLLNKLKGTNIKCIFTMFK